MQVGTIRFRQEAGGKGKRTVLSMGRMGQADLGLVSLHHFSGSGHRGYPELSGPEL